MSGVLVCLLGSERMEEMGELTPDQAAKKIQNMFHAHKARSWLRLLVRGIYQKILDEASGQYYYFNTRTGQAQWTKPIFLKGDDDIGKTPRGKQDKRARRPVKKAEDMTEDEAVRKIQGMYHTRKARAWLRLLVRGIYQKVYDPDSGEYYYFNTRTKQAQWTKPIFLKGDDDIGKTPRKNVDKAAHRPKKARPIKKAEDMTDEEAAHKLQGMWRARQARLAIKRMLRDVWMKVYDESSGGWYYFNKVTHESSWEKPKLLRQSSLTETPRHIRMRRARKIKKAEDMTDEEAAMKLQGMWRARQARLAIKRMLRDVWMKVYDESSGGWYYFNKVTHESSWEKPKLLGSSDLAKTPRHKTPRQATAPRKLAHEMTDEEAATKLQGMWRTRQARMAIKRMLRDVWMKVFDESTGGWYYWNKVTHESSWEKPMLLRASSLRETPRDVRRKKVRKIKKAEDMTDEEAASKLQAMWRTRRSRWLLREMVKRLWTKVPDGNGNFYYYNQQTGESKWTKPLLLDHHDVDVYQPEDGAS